MRNPNNQSLTAARFRRLRNALRGLALTGALLAFTASTAGARPPSPDPQPFGDPSSAPTILHVSAPSAFDWGDAGIGVAAAFGAFLIDTCEKDGSTLLDWLTIDEVTDLVGRCRSADSEWGADKQAASRRWTGRWCARSPRVPDSAARGQHRALLRRARGHRFRGQPRAPAVRRPGPRTPAC